MVGQDVREIVGDRLNASEASSGVADGFDELMEDDAELLGPTMELYLILYPKEREETILQTLEEIGVPGYTEFPKCIGRGRRIRHFDTPTWPGATGAIFTVISREQAPALVQPFRRLNRELEERSRGVAGLHIFALPCQQVI